MSMLIRQAPLGPSGRLVGNKNGLCSPNFSLWRQSLTSSHSEVAIFICSSYLLACEENGASHISLQAISGQRRKIP